MTSPQMSIVRIEGTETHMRMFLKDVNSRASKIVRAGSTTYIAVPSQELGWLDKIARDVGVKKVEVQGFPQHGRAPCGIYTTQVGHHIGRCKKCVALRRPDYKAPSEVRTVLKVEGLQDMSLKGLVDLMRQRMDDALALAQEYDNVIKAYEKIPGLEEQMKTLQRQMTEHREALKYFTERR